MTRKLQSAYSHIRIGDPLDEKTLMGPLIDQQAVEAMRSALDRIRAEGGEIIYGGDELGGCYVKPALVKAHAGMPILQEEVFAPILYLIEFDTLDEAIEWHNGVPQGLSSAMFTTNLISAETFLSARGSDCGIANVNIGTSGAEIGGCIRRRERYRRRARIRQRCMEGLHAPPDCYHQLVRRVAARARY